MALPHDFFLLSSEQKCASQPVLDNYAVLTLVYHHSSTVKMNIKISGKSLRVVPNWSYYIPSCHHWKVSWGADDHVKTRLAAEPFAAFLKGTQGLGANFLSKGPVLEGHFWRRRMALNLTLQFWHPAHKPEVVLLKRFGGNETKKEVGTAILDSSVEI